MRSSSTKGSVTSSSSAWPGNTGATDPLLIGSMDYSVLTFGSVLLMVLGHTECGAVEGRGRRGDQKANP